MPAWLSDLVPHVDKEAVTPHVVKGPSMLQRGQPLLEPKCVPCCGVLQVPC